jgi:hypothetical protein
MADGDNLEDRFFSIIQKFEKEVSNLKTEVSELRNQINSFRTEKAGEPASPAAVPAPPSTGRPFKPPQPIPAQIPAPPKQIPAPIAVLTEPVKPPPAQAPRPITPPPSSPPPAAPVIDRVQASPPLQKASTKSIAAGIKSALALEEALGTNWLNKLGIISLVLGIALFGIYEFNELGPGGKVALSCVAGLALLIGGIYFDKRERYRFLGRAGIGGGWALIFFVSYAIYHVQAMKLLESQLIDLVIMLVLVIVIAAHTLRYRSQVVTGLAFLLGYATIALSHDTVYSLSAGAVLALGLVILILKMRWYELEAFGILSSYINHFYFLWKILGPEPHHGKFPEFWTSAAILLAYWCLFRISYIVRKIGAPKEENLSTVSALMNTILLLLVMRFQSQRPELAFYALLVLGVIEFSLGQLRIVKRRRIAFIMLSTIGAILMIVSVPFRYSGGSVAIMWIAGAELFLIAGIAAQEKVFRRIGLITGLAAAVQVAATELAPFFSDLIVNKIPTARYGVIFLTLGFAFYVNSQFLNRRWATQFGDLFERTLAPVHSYLGAAAAFLGIWALCPDDWISLGWAALMIVLAFGCGRLQAADLLAQSVGFGASALVRAITFDLRQDAGHAHRLITACLLAAAFYFSARLFGKLKSNLQQGWSGLSTWAGTALIVLLIWREVPGPWIPAAWIAFGVALAFIGRRLKLASLCCQENIIALCAILRAIDFNYALDENCGHFTLRLITIFPIAAGLYLSSRMCSLPESKAFLPIAYLHTWAATGLLAALAWFDAPVPWLAVIWAAFALVLAVIDRRFKISDLRWQSHLLAALAAIQVIRINMPLAGLFHGVSLRLITVGIVALIFYALASVIRMPDRVPQPEIKHIYSWVASFFVALLMWYELQPLNVAVGGGLFGLLLFEIGLWRRVAQLRFQGYVALASAFIRIFFANLDIPSVDGEIINSSIITVLSLAAIFYFVYSRLDGRKDELAEVRAAHVDVLICYAGSISIGALIYFRLLSHGDWIVTAWAGLVLLFFAAAWLLKRSVFLHQAILLSFAVLIRGIFHNLFGSSYFVRGDWSGRYVVIGVAVAIMLLSLPFAFRLRNRALSFANAGIFKFLTAAAERYPEQVMFFIPLLLLTLMLAIKMRAGMVTVAWGCEAVLIILLALAVGERSYRLTGLALILMCVVKIAVIDAWHLAARDRYVTFIILGAALLAVSYLYSKHREKIRKLL